MAGQLSDKAVRYLKKLDDARCDGHWGEVPELARKVEKHAPQRKCLTITARTEAQIAGQGPQRPVRAVSDASKSPLIALIPPLRDACEQADAWPEDAFEASVCLAWMHWLVGAPQLAVARLPDDFTTVLKGLLEGERTIGRSVRVCAIKGAYTKGRSFEELHAIESAALTYLSMLQYLSSTKNFSTNSTTSPQFCLWTQCLLTRLCVVSTSPNVPFTVVDIDTTLRLFRIWETFWTTSSCPRNVTGYDPREDLGYLWRDVWFVYYLTLSDILQRGWVYDSEHTPDAPPRILPPDKRLTDSQFLASRMRQIADLQRIEAYNERYLMKETQFPRATEHNEDVEKWADAVMRNWRVMCGPSWRDEELGHGGKGVVARGVLDILYRAATKTYHSTQILRHLFTVHASLAEFDLAFKAFDSYVEIVTRGKDRAEKSGNTDHTQDDDDIVLRTSAEAIRILCRFGGRREAEKAKAIGERMDKWLKQRIPVVPASRSSREDEEDRTETAVSPRAMAISYSAIAMSEAHWARATYDAKLRVELQRNAIINFEKSLDPKLEDSQNVETMYSHALLLAEAREIPGATKLAKQALALLAPNSIPALGPDGVISVDEGAAVNGNYVSERRSVPLCHLLALLLTSRSEYEKAVDVCDHAFKQFRDPANLYGAEESDQFKSDHLNELSSSSFNEKAEQQKRRGIVDRMEAFERESLLQIKMTELSLIQSIEGTNAAVESSDQLLALFARMFGDPSTAPTHPPAMNSFSSPPKTAKSFRESILGRSSASKRLSFRPKSSMAPSSTSVASRPSTMATYTTAAAPTIQVIEEEGQDSQQNGEKESHHHHLLQHKKRHTPRPQSSWSESAKLKKRRSHSDESRPFTADGPNDTSPSAYSPPPPVPSIQTTTNAHDFEYHAISSNEEQPATQKFPHIAHNLSLEEEPPPAGQHEQPPHQDVRLPAPFPGSSDMPYYAALEPKFPPLQERRHKISLLVQVWLFIAGLYTRADMYDDAEGAVDEAHKLVQDFEVEVSKRDPSIRAFGERGWGGGKSVEGLWGDVWAEQGHLARARKLPHEAMAHYEKALSRFPDHPSATVGLSEILLDIYCQKIPLEAVDRASLLPSCSPAAKDTVSKTTSQDPLHSNSNSNSIPNMNSDSTRDPRTQNHANGTAPPAQTKIITTSPEELNRIAARDRAYGLLSSLTKLGSGWDYSEAWFSLARAYEEGGQVDKSKEVLWWCVNLEETRPLRNWDVIGLGGGVL